MAASNLYGSLFFPPITSIISSVSFRSGSNPKLPPGEDSKRNPKSMREKIYHLNQSEMIELVHTCTCTVNRTLLLY